MVGEKTQPRYRPLLKDDMARAPVRSLPATDVPVCRIGGA